MVIEQPLLALPVVRLSIKQQSLEQRCSAVQTCSTGRQQEADDANAKFSCCCTKVKHCYFQAPPRRCICFLFAQHILFNDAILIFERHFP